MKPRTIGLLWLLTIIYLCFELAFNARLLDVVGSISTIAQIHQIEQYGRTLSGIAVALIVLQYLLNLRSQSTRRKPSYVIIFLACFITVGVVYFSLDKLVNTLVNNSTPEMRRISTQLVLAKSELIAGNAELDGLSANAEIFNLPEGKAFIALFPIMALSIDNLDNKLLTVTRRVLGNQIDRSTGGPGGLYSAYTKAAVEVSRKWQNYAKLPSGSDMQAEIKRQQDSAWSQYERDLNNKGWTPWTVPFNARNAVVKKVRQKVPVSSTWETSDEAGFREAVAAKVRQRYKKVEDPIVNGQRMPRGLDYGSFFLQSSIQTELRKTLSIPSYVVIRPSYRSAEEFESQVYQPFLKKAIDDELRIMNSPAQTFADGEINAQRGLDAARAVIAPPLALLFSLLGAIGHTAKLLFLTVKGMLSLNTRLKPIANFAWVIPVFTIVILWGGLSSINNSITTSRVYKFMEQQVQNEGHLKAKALNNAMHVVAVGQGYGYPLNEFIRVYLLQGFKFGWTPNQT